MTIKTRLQRAERAASSPAHEDWSAAIEAHRQMILDKLASGKCGIFESAEWNEDPDERKK